MSILQVYSPYDGSEIGDVPQTQPDQALAALEMAHEAYLNRDRWLKPHERIAILRRTAELLSERKEDFVKIAAAEGGKPYIDSAVEVDRAIQGIHVAIAEMHTLSGHEIPMNITQSSEHRLAMTYREPNGVVFAISAFNHPLNLIIHQVVPAIAVGCPVLVKPASATPMSCYAFVKLLYEAGLPEQWCQMVAVKYDLAEKMVSDPRIHFLSFIGSSSVGWYLRSKLAPGAQCALEHGGAAPVIVEADADIDDAVPLLVKGGMYHAGQVCVSVQRIFAHAKIAKNLAKRIADQASALRVGDPMLETTEVGPLISHRDVDRVHEWVQEAIYKGAKCLTGGEKISDSCYQPTVLLDPPDDVRVSTSEIFGPVICVYTYKDRQEAIQRANKPPFYFQASVFTKDLDAAIDTVKRLKATAVMVNDHTAFRVDWMPFGGRRHSGLNTGGIPYSMRDMSHEKLMVVRSALL